MTSSPTDTLEVQRAVRQRDLVPAERLAACHVVVIGVGAIGRQVALQLAAIGISEMTLMDDDVVAVENLAPQGYFPSDVGLPKVEATMHVCGRIHPDLLITPIEERFHRSRVREWAVDKQYVVFVCVDSITARRRIWQHTHSRAACFIDGRMSAEVLRVLTIADPSSDTFFPTTLFHAEEAFTGSCTAKSTIYTASLAAGLMVGQMTKWLRGLPVDADVTFNLLAMELSTTAGHSTN